ncbi:MAG: ADP-forming succinate--CoA ligase subunit beta [Bacillota bacterium]
MKLYEYMGKDLFALYGLAVPRGRVVSSPAEAMVAARKIGCPVAIKSQVFSGKRGKAGGIKFAATPEEAAVLSGVLLSSQVQGLPVERLLVEEKLVVDRELYLALAVDGAAGKPVLITSLDGGMDIEEVPEDKVIKLHLDIETGLQPYHTREINRRLGLTGTLAREYARTVTILYRMFTDLDAELVEINPLVISGERIIAADAKITIDDAALYRQKEVPRVEERTAVEKLAFDAGLAFVELDGKIAVMANRAGITMGTLDTIQYYGGRPANFLDAGGGTGMEATARALEILLATNPKVIFINIFGGITRCDDVARAFAKVKEERGVPVPVVIRLVGTNQEEGVKILKECGIQAYQSMAKAVRKAVELAQRNND